MTLTFRDIDLLQLEAETIVAQMLEDFYTQMLDKRGGNYGVQHTNMADGRSAPSLYPETAAQESGIQAEGTPVPETPAAPTGPGPV